MSVLNKLSLVILIVLSLWLGGSHINDARISSQLGQVSEVERTLQEHERVLEFMVWPNERRKLLDQSINLIHSEINQDPMQVRHWKRLLNLQYEYDPEITRLSWILDKIYVLDGWNKETLISLSRYCVPFVFDDEEAEPLACQKIVRHLPLQDQETQLARKIGISVEDLGMLIKRYQK